MHRENSGLESFNLCRKLNEIEFPNKVTNSPYAVNSIAPQTPISIMMELNNWFNESLEKVVIDPGT